MPRNGNLWKFFSPKKKEKYELHNLADAILQLLSVGSQWSNLSGYFLKWESDYYHFKKWDGDGTIARFNFGLNMIERERRGKSAMPNMLSIDSQSAASVMWSPIPSGWSGTRPARRTVVLAKRWSIPCWDIRTGWKGIGRPCLYQNFKQWVEDTVIGSEVEISSRPSTEKGFIQVKWRGVTERTYCT